MFSYSINKQNFIVKRYLFICGNICSTITFLCFINQYCMYKVQSLISNYNIKKRQLIIKFQKTKERFKTSFNINNTQTASTSGIGRQKKLFFFSIRFGIIWKVWHGDFCLKRIILLHWSLREKRASLRAKMDGQPVELLQYSCFTRSQTCCMGGLHHPSDLHRGKRKAEKVERKWKHRNSWRLMMCCVLLLRLPSFSMDNWGRGSQM